MSGINEAMLHPTLGTASITLVLGMLVATFGTSQPSARYSSSTSSSAFTWGQKVTRLVVSKMRKSTPAWVSSFTWRRSTHLSVWK